MFRAQNKRLQEVADAQPNRIQELERIFVARTNVYVDYANVRPWSKQLGWHIDPERLSKFLRSFVDIQKLAVYQGTLVGDEESERQIKRMKKVGLDVVTKPVKIMKHSIDISSIEPDSPALLKSFVRRTLLKQLRLEDVRYLNERLGALNQAGVLELEDRKCNFDVEIGRDMLLDFEHNACETFVLWSGDSDFADPIRQLLKDGKRVYLFATARRVARELNDLCAEGLVIYDIQKIRDFICWPREVKEKAA